MNSLVIAIISLLFFFFGYHFYSRKIAKLWDLDPKRKTPAKEKCDGVDYIPARHWTVLFGHHFASIAGAGPILGPVIACCAWGWGPALVWIVLGSIFLGGVHDFSALMVSLRHEGKSVAEVAEGVFSYRAKLIFAAFVWLALVLVVAVFAAVTAQTLSNEPRVVIPTFGLILVAVCVGVMLYRWKVNQVLATVIGLAFLGGLLFLGNRFPVVLPFKNASTVWILILLAYAFVASILPVNLLLQPRDYLSTFILFFGLIFGYLGIFLSHPQLHTPMFVKWGAPKGPVWPMLCVIIACGAISGFHSLIAGGTTSKQLANEQDARKIGYGGMVLEGVLAVLALVAVCGGLYWTGSSPRELIYPELMKEGNWIITFATGFGQIVKPICGATLGALVAMVMLNSFVLTTLDSATRINRYIGEELFGEGLGIKIFRNRYLATAVVIGVAVYLAMGNWKLIWPIFGASNQLVAALTLLVVSSWLLSRGKSIKYTIIPCGFMLVTTIAALGWQVSKFIPEGKYLLSGIGIILIILAGVMVWEAARAYKKFNHGLHGLTRKCNIR